MLNIQEFHIIVGDRFSNEQHHTLCYDLADAKTIANQLLTKFAREYQESCPSSVQMEWQIHDLARYKKAFHHAVKTEDVFDNHLSMIERGQ